MSYKIENIDRVLAISTIPFALFMFLWCKNEEIKKENEKDKQQEIAADIRFALNNTNIVHY